MRGLIPNSFLCLLLLPSLLAAATQFNPREYEIKAVYLYRYSKFIDWSDTSFAQSDANFLFCVVGDNPFRDSFDKNVSRKNVNGRAVAVLYLQAVDDLSACQVLFISRSEQDRVAEIVAAVADQPILTVSDIGNFVRNGGMIEFYNHRNRIRFLIDPDSIRQVGLNINAHLLRVAEIVRN